MVVVVVVEAHGHGLSSQSTFRPQGKDRQTLLPM
jgi:hypothetical protein